MPVKYEVVPADSSHIDAICRNVRQADVDEVWAAGMVTVRTALEMSLENATLARTWLVDGIPAAMGGITGQREAATIWLISTELVEKHRRAFLGDSRRALDAVLGDFDLLCNFVDARNLRAISWLRWLGFHVDVPKPFGPMGRDFHFFWWRREAREVQSDNFSE